MELADALVPFKNCLGGRFLVDICLLKTEMLGDCFTFLFSWFHKRTVDGL